MRPPHRRRRGTVIVYSAILLVFMCGMVAFAVDVGIIALARSELHRASDASALAAAAELVPDANPRFPLQSPVAVAINVSDDLALALGRDATTTATLAGRELSLIDPSSGQPPVDVLPVVRRYARQQGAFVDQEMTCRAEDVDVFLHPHLAPSRPLLPITQLDDALHQLLLRSMPGLEHNAVRVTLRRDQLANGPVRLFFAPVIGKRYAESRATAAAAFAPGYRVTTGARVLPLAMDVSLWQVLRIGNGTVNGVPLAELLLGQSGALMLVDEHTWNPDLRRITSGPDGIWEALIVSGVDANGPSGGLGGLIDSLLGLPGRDSSTLLPDDLAPLLVTLHLRPNAGEPSVSELQRQILNGLSDQDLDDELQLPFRRQGRPGVDRELLVALEHIIGEPRILPLYATISAAVGGVVSEVTGQTTTYRIVGWGGVVVTEVRSVGPVTYVKLQPASYSSSRVLEARSSDPALSDLVFTAPLLVE